MEPSKRTRLFFASLGALGMAVSCGLMFREAARSVDDLERHQDAVVFRDLADCTAKGYREAACKHSELAAHAAGSFLGTRVSEAQCAAAQYDCDRQSIRINSMSTEMQYIYSRVAEGWIAARSDITKAMPAYRSKQAGMVISPSGRVMQAN